MWPDLPHHLLDLIFSYLSDVESRLSASAACKRWREFIVGNSNVTLKRKQIVVYVCGRRGKCITDFDVKMMMRFICHTETLIFKWCACKTDDLLKVLSKILEVKHLPVRQIKITGNLSIGPYGCDSSKLLDRELLYKSRKIELFSSLLKGCKRLEVLDLGFEPDLSQNVLKEAKDKINGRKLHTLNIAAIRRTTLTDSITSEMLNQFVMLSKLALNWDRHFLDLINILSARFNAESRLKQLIVVMPSMTYKTETLRFPAKEQWVKVAEFQPGLKLKLVIVEDDLHLLPVEMMVQMEPINICVQALSVIYGNPDSLLGYYVAALRQNLCHLEEISIHYVEVSREMQDSSHFFHLIQNHNLLVKLEKLELCGMFIEDGTLLEIGTLFGSRLKELVVYKMDVVHESEVTGYMLPLTKAQVYGIEKAMTAALGRDWQLVMKRHTHRSTHGNLLSNIEGVLQEICSVATEF